MRRRGPLNSLQSELPRNCKSGDAPPAVHKRDLRVDGYGRVGMRPSQRPLSTLGAANVLVVYVCVCVLVFFKSQVLPSEYLVVIYIHTLLCTAGCWLEVPTFNAHLSRLPYRG